MIENNHNQGNEDQIEFIARTVADVAVRLEHVEDRLDKLEDRSITSEFRQDDFEKKLDNFVTKEDHQEVMNTLDKILSIVQKGSDESTLQSYRIRELQDTVDTHDKDIKIIKEKVGM